VFRGMSAEEAESAEKSVFESPRDEPNGDARTQRTKRQFRGGPEISRLSRDERRGGGERGEGRGGERFGIAAGRPLTEKPGYRE
jgi:hypothetical protein